MKRYTGSERIIYAGLLICMSCAIHAMPLDRQDTIDSLRKKPPSWTRLPIDHLDEIHQVVLDDLDTEKLLSEDLKQIQYLLNTANNTKPPYR